MTVLLRRSQWKLFAALLRGCFFLHFFNLLVQIKGNCYCFALFNRVSGYPPEVDLARYPKGDLARFAINLNEILDIGSSAFDVRLSLPCPFELRISNLEQGGCFLVDKQDGNVVPVSGSDKKISALELVFLGIGSVIGGSFFLGSGIAIEKAGPSVVLGYVIGGAICYLVLLSLGYLALQYRNRESFRGYIQEALGPGAGFVVGWSAWLTSIIAIIAESIAMSTYTRAWLPRLPLWILTLFFILLALGINLRGLKIVDRSEGLMSVVKTGALTAFVLLVVLFVFHAPREGYTAFGLANLTPFLPRGIGGLTQAAVICTFAYGLGAFAVATGDTKDPRKDIPRAVLGMALGQAIFFILPTLALVFAVPWTIISTNSSPFVTALQHLGITAGGSVLNAVVLIASFSTLVASMFSAVVLLSSLARDREAPGILAVRKNGLAFNALLTSISVVLLLSLAALLLPRNTYNYAVSTTGYLSFVNWGGILMARLKISLPGYNQGRLEKNGFALAGIALLALLSVSILGLTAPEQIFSFIFAAAFILLMVLIEKTWLAGGTRRRRFHCKRRRKQ
jgi:L-asparagine transporter-like permease